MENDSQSPPQYPERARLPSAFQFPREKDDGAEAMYSSTDEDYPFEEKVQTVLRMTSRPRRATNETPPPYSRPSKRQVQKTTITKADSGIERILTGSFLNYWICLLFPLALVSIILHYVFNHEQNQSRSIAVFIFSTLAMPPLIAMMLFALDETAPQIPKIPRLFLRASFYNAPQILIGNFCLFQHEYTVIRAMIFGSVLSHILLTLGTCFIYVHGKSRRLQYYNESRVEFHSNILLFGASIVLMPSLFYSSLSNSSGWFRLSHAASIAALSLFVVYIIYLQFLPVMIGDARPCKNSKFKKGSTIRSNARINARLIGHHKRQGINYRPDQLTDVDFEATVSFKFIIVVLAFSVTLLVFCSMALVDSIGPVTDIGVISPTFIGFIIIPLATNLIDQVSAVIIARIDIDLSIDILMSSSIDHLLGAFPLIAISSWIANPDHFVGESMTMEFHNFQSILLFASILVVSHILRGGKVIWIYGVALVAAYCLMALGAWYIPN